MGRELFLCNFNRSEEFMLNGRLKQIDIMDHHQVARILKVTDRSVLNWIYDGKLDARKDGRYWVISYDAIRDFIDNETANDKNKRFNYNFNKFFKVTN